MNRPNKATIYATILVLAAASITSGALYALATQPANQQQPMGITYGEPEPGGMPGLNNRPNELYPENNTDGPQL
jgi:hypothetical protein